MTKDELHDIGRELRALFNWLTNTHKKKPGFRGIVFAIWLVVAFVANVGVLAELVNPDKYQATWLIVEAAWAVFYPAALSGFGLLYVANSGMLRLRRKRYNDPSRKTLAARIEANERMIDA